MQGSLALSTSIIWLRLCIDVARLTCFQLRRSYLVVKKLVNQSGWGWDDDQKVAVAPSDVWDTYIAVCSCSRITHKMLRCPQAHPEVKKWRNTPFPHYHDLQMLIEGRHATGERAYRVLLASDDINNDWTPTQDTEDIDDNFSVSQPTDVASQVS